ncbi:hypothetical protein GJAV_G00006090 [Gymnothorax javanicus]|nr:hypothetical protein GJAV_G00006090 [Gymnothorax javanicus]
MRGALFQAPQVSQLGYASPQEMVPQASHHLWFHLQRRVIYKWLLLSPEGPSLYNKTLHIISVNNRARQTSVISDSKLHRGD